METQTLQAQIPWIERTFVFNLHLGMFPNIIERLRGTPARLEDAVKGLSKEQLTNKPGIGWSIQEHVGHFADLEKLHHARLNDFLSGAIALHAADMENKATRLADHNKENIEDLLRIFRNARTDFIKHAESMSPDIHELRPIHPRLKVPMRLLDMCQFIAEHDDHHLATIHRLATTEV